MNLELFIARRIASQKGNAFSARIMRIAIAAIALSIAVMIVATALSAGFKNEISTKIFGFWSHIQIRHYKVDSFVETVPIDRNQPFYSVTGEGETRTISSPLIEGGQVDYIEEKLALGLFPYDAASKTKGGVKHIQVYANKAGIIQIKSELEGIILKGVSDDFDWTFLNRFIIRGDTLTYQRPSPNRGILISETTARRLKVDTSDQFIVNFVDNGRQVGRKFKVAGIYKTGLEEFDEKFALVDIRIIQRLNGWTEDQVSGFEVFVDDIDDLDIFGEYIYYNQLPQELYSSTIRELHPAIFGWLDLQDVNERVIIIIMIFVSIINMITALMILILERTNMIGVLKALGMPNRSIQQVFLVNAAYIIGWGLLIGNVLGISLCLIQDYFEVIKLNEEHYYVQVAPILLRFWTVFLLNLGTMVVTLGVLTIPSFLAKRIDPVKAIRFK